MIHSGLDDTTFIAVEKAGLTYARSLSGEANREEGQAALYEAAELAAATTDEKELSIMTFAWRNGVTIVSNRQRSLGNIDSQVIRHIALYAYSEMCQALTKNQPG